MTAVCVSRVPGSKKLAAMVTAEPSAVVWSAPASTAGTTFVTIVLVSAVAVAPS